MVDPDVFVTIAVIAVISYGAVLFYRQTREKRAEMSQLTYKRTLISLSFGIAAVLIWFALAFLYLRYDATRATMADESAGRIYSITNHGHVVFLTLAERCYLFLLGTVAFASFLCSYIFDRKVKKSLAEPEPGPTPE